MEKNREAKSGGGAHVLIFWICVAGTIMMLLAGVGFWIQYMKHKDNISASVVLLHGVTPPAADAGMDEVRRWIGNYSDALPNCRCSIGSPGHEVRDRALLFCVGYSSGPEACEAIPGKMPAGVTIKVSRQSDVSAYTKLLFLLAGYASYDIIHPVTNRPLAEP